MRVRVALAMPSAFTLPDERARFDFEADAAPAINAMAELDLLTGVRTLMILFSAFVDRIEQLDAPSESVAVQAV